MRTIPEISAEALARLALTLRPVVSDGGGFREIETPDPVNVAFTWAPVPVGDLLDLAEVGCIHTYHNWGYYGIFKPSVAEVLAQVPAGYLDRVTHFHLQHDEAAPLLSKPDEHNISGYHRAIVRLFKTQG